MISTQIIQEEPRLIAVAFVFYGEMYDQESGITYNYWEMPCILTGATDD